MSKEVKAVLLTIVSIVAANLIVIAIQDSRAVADD